MILIADSGSSKTDWILLDQQLKITSEFVTKGLNPNVLSADVIADELNNSAEINRYRSQVRKLFFYGSGCGSESGISIITSVFMQLFPSAEIEVKSDLYAAAYATCGLKSGIVCILGTGSNSCFYDGTSIHGANYNLGYLLGDEGSGCALGKRLLRDYFYGILPKELKESFNAQYQLSRDELLRHVYHEPFPNQYIASFVPFIKEHIEHPYFNYLISFGFDEFLKIFVTTITNFKVWQANFVGSVAFNFKDQLIVNCKNNSVVVGKIIASPIQDLAQYHIFLESR